MTKKLWGYQIGKSYLEEQTVRQVVKGLDKDFSKSQTGALSGMFVKSKEFDKINAAGGPGGEGFKKELKKVVTRNKGKAIVATVSSKGSNEFKVNAVVIGNLGIDGRTWIDLLLGFIVDDFGSDFIDIESFKEDKRRILSKGSPNPVVGAEPRVVVDVEVIFTLG